MIIENCRSCADKKLELILTLGSTPLANSLLSDGEVQSEEPKYPLDVVFCHECSLVQITETVPPEQLFRHYAYFSSYSDTMLNHCKMLAGQMVSERNLNKESLVVDIASNDGYLLQYYVEQGVPVLGIEPALNIAKAACERGINTLTEFFGSKLAEELVSRGQQADVIHANNVLAHVADLNGFVAGIATLLKDDGIAVIEVPYVVDLVDHLEFDTIYHEHLCYFSANALKSLFERNGLKLLDVERVPIHGGSLQLKIGKQGTTSQRAHNLLQEETRRRVHQYDFYREFAAKVTRLKQGLRHMLADLKRSGKRIAAYGASAKGSTLLNFFEIGAETIDFIVDRSPVKQGFFTPGTHFPICAPEKLLADMPDFVLLLSWNFAEEILKQQNEYLVRGGQFILPIPQPKIITTVVGNGIVPSLVGQFG